MSTFELQNGRVIVTYTETDWSLMEVCDWNGNDLSGTNWERIAIEEIIERQILRGELDETE